MLRLAFASNTAISGLVSPIPAFMRSLMASLDGIASMCRSRMPSDSSDCMRSS